MTQFADWHGIDSQELLRDVHGRRAVDVIQVWAHALVRLCVAWSPA